ncbi:MULTISPECIES: bifunctional glycosyltransferase family 2 protein/CDP-glycerol:glycerophosphate glycerophosphotransferase [unclassified Streptomyces]|uniref:bifunctional glycosyltransferase/CDP-glycerol:glycerophosphate glycerophosphotransferase n=1 Tax=unclassified Streptomyces TaxID=2593676 RepID=UPI000DB922FC|nr:MULTISPECIES: bifunctional glycosyltransferase family 2 protein/CDP-glycerol:glycerophosphate glycerophosphotransferase [unclassified Streptomyces]MYT71248.1 glycosyltransferase [Streptomyces sp. SID8367]RAJ72515.1 CRISPR system Cascade subunit CasB [Streptomyces sp. PsTaAH-137]
MPRFSVIVPAYKVQAYLHACLASVLEQDFTDLEVIAVDDCSPDACGEIIDEFAARDARVRAVHLDENVGLGRARNAGLTHATGDYVLFLDSDDTLTPGALRAIADRVKETGSPDVLLFDYARTFWDGREVRNQFAHLLAQDGPVPFTLADRPGLLKILMVVWNKAYSREFIEREGFTFPPGYYEDTPWTYPALMAAESLATLDRVCVHYRQRRGGNILGTTSRRHFDIFDQYERVFEFLDQHPDLDAQWRPAMFRRMVDHLSTLFTKRGRLPRRSRAEFLRRARGHYARYRTPGARVSSRTRLRHALVRLGTHRTYRALCAATAVGRRLSRTLASARRTLRAAALQFHYRVQLRLPVRENDAVFASYWGRGHGCNPGALEEAFRVHAPHVRTSWIAAPEHHHTVPAATRRLTPGTAAYWTALARSKYLVNNVNFDRRLVKRAEQVFVQTQHGTPLKKMGLDLQDHPAAARGTDFAQLLANADKWDYVLSGNRHSTLTWERAYPSAYTTLEYGYPRNDRFQRASLQETARLRETLRIPRDSIAILYAPTHRDYRVTQRLPLDLERMLRTLGPRFTLLARAHHSYAAPLTGIPAARLIDVSDHPSVETLCLASDALVTDYSSLMFDYAALDRPIVIHADDWEAYEAARGTYFDLRSFPPGAVARSEDELIDIFATGHWRGSRSAQLRAAFRERFCPYEDGGAGERVVRRVVFGEGPSGVTALPRQGAESAPAPRV